MIRPSEVLELTATAATVPEARADIESQVPDGYELTDALPSMEKGGVSVTIRAKARPIGFREITGEDMPALEAQVPEGWRLLSIRQG